MKKLLLAFFILIILLPMLFYLNPFVWGMRRMPRYEASDRTKIFIERLNKKYHLSMYAGTNELADTLWYFRDIKNHKMDKLMSFKLILYPDDKKQIDVKVIGNYITQFNADFEHKKYFDSLIVTLDNDSVIYKANMR